MTRLVLRGGTIVDQNGSRRGDVVIDPTTGTVESVGSPVAAETGEPVDAAGTAGADPAAARVVTLDAGGCVVTPGFVDLGAHVRQPGDEAAETVDTAANAAALGGYTAIVALPDTDPCVDNAAVVSELLALAKSAACEVVPGAAVTVGRNGTKLVPFAELVEAGVRVFTDANRSLCDPGVLRRALEYLDGINELHGVRAVIADRPELDALAGGGVMNEGEWSSRLGVPGRPATAEEVQVAQDLAVARLAGTPIHLRQVSSAGSLALIRAAKKEGQVVTVDVSPHHLLLDESACRAFDTNTKLLPPLRTASDRAALLGGVLDGTVDAIASDHAPWTVDAKERPFDEAPFGVLGLQTTIASLLTDLDVGLDALLPALSWQPAGIAGLGDRHGGPIEPGRPANLTVVDPTATWTVEPARLASRSVNTPYGERQLTGKIRHTVVAGRATVVDGRTVA
jgi:dihydroorotase